MPVFRDFFIKALLNTMIFAQNQALNVKNQPNDLSEYFKGEVKCRFYL